MIKKKFLKFSMLLQSAWEAWKSHTHFLDSILIDIFRPENIFKNIWGVVGRLLF